jgi:hypothetical protein
MLKDFSFKLTGNVWTRIFSFYVSYSTQGIFEMQTRVLMVDIFAIVLILIMSKSCAYKLPMFSCDMRLSVIEFRKWNLLIAYTRDFTCFHYLWIIIVTTSLKITLNDQMHNAISHFISQNTNVTKNRVRCFLFLCFITLTHFISNMNCQEKWSCNTNKTFYNWNVPLASNEMQFLISFI